MTDQPRPTTALILDDDGTPTSVVDLDRLDLDVVALAYAVARHSDGTGALTGVMNQWFDRLGPDVFGAVAAGALKVLAHNIYAPTLQVLAEIAPPVAGQLRGKLAELADGQEPNQ